MIDPSDLLTQQPGTDVGTPQTDQLEARRFPQFQAPIPRTPGISAPRMPKAPQRAQGQGGGFSMDTLMPLLLMAAPFLEAHQPGYGMGLVGGVLQHQQEQAQARRQTILSMAKEFGNTPDDQWAAAEGLLKSQGLDAQTISAIKAARVVFRDPNFALNEQIRHTREFLAPEVAQQAVSGLPLQQILTPDRLRAAQVAGIQLPYDVQTTAPGQAAIPGAMRGTPSEIGTAAAQPVAAVPAQERVVVRGRTAVPTYGQLFGATAPQIMNTPFANTPIPVDAQGIPNLREAAQTVEAITRTKITTDEAAATHRKNYQEYLRGKLMDGLRSPGSVDFATLRTQMASDEAGGMSFNGEFVKAQDAVTKEIAARPVFVTVGGQTYPVSSAEALKITLGEQDKVTVPVNGTLVRMTGDQFANYQLAVKRENRARKEQPLRATIQGVNIGSMADLRVAVAAGAIDPAKLDPVTRRSLGQDPEAIPAQQALHSLRTAEAELASFQPYVARFPKLQEAIGRFITGKATDEDMKALQKEQTTVPIGGVPTTPLNLATSLATVQQKVDYWRGIVGQPQPQPVPTPAGPGAGAPVGKTMSQAELHMLAQAAGMTDAQYAAVAQQQGYTIGP